MIVHTASGSVEGVQLDGAYVFRGIPYAALPIGPLRFQPPAPPEPWEGIRTCDQFGPIACQRHDPNGFMPELPQSEDCLNLNVWTSSVVAEPKPVMVYIHGGGFVGGKGAECDGLRYAAENGIVYVSINYRLGALGFLYLGELLGAGYETSGNNGMLDIAAALRWVQANIAGFGGDPAQVTVIGNSAGAKCTATLFTMECARGLYHRAIAQSGATQSIRDRRTAMVTTAQLLHELGIQPVNAARLLDLPADQLIEAQGRVGWDTSRSLHMFGPVADGITIPLDPFEALKRNTNHPPLMIGTNDDESAMFIHYDLELREPCHKTVDRLFGQNAPCVWASFEHYASVMAENRAWERTLTEHLYTIGAIQLANTLASSGSAVWMYRLAYGGSLGATHGYENSLIQYASEAVAEQGDVAEYANDMNYVSVQGAELAEAMRTAWISFICTGNPNPRPSLNANGSSIPEWPAYGATPNTMVLDMRSEVRNDLPKPFGAGCAHQVWRAEP
ncbi:carboxylesterase/lipase family protein [Paenibacillus sp. MMS18-CY102]|uniref:carboxylesterase/lipase family protein n=1 Tax=Paenibacillus sp. MMS18-CY102 TaxID=2682849 RepID=UPI00136573EC|nr:carboxylesterase family protein [Paenibacillus sp. MMS18-CY102]MWC31368.1 carboxylesterase family protein [Paenibacillus sp. MMS18-CY102]